MKDDHKTPVDPHREKEQLIRELAELRRRVAELEQGIHAEALRRGEGQLTEAQPVAHLGSWEWDITRDTTVWSDELYRIFGVDPERFDPNAYEAFIDCVHPGDREHVGGVIEEAINDKGPFSVEYRIVRPDGMVRNIYAWGEVICDETGKPSVMIGTSQDITERVQAESERDATLKALRESEERYRSLFDNVPVGIYRSTPGGQFLDVNLALVEMLGYPDRESLLAVNAVDLYLDAGERRRWQEVLEREGVARSWEAQVRRYDGAVIWIADNAQAVPDQEGQVLYYEGTLEDITERVQAESQRDATLKALRESEERYRTLFEQANDAIHVANERDEIIDVNRRACEMAGYSREELLTMRVSDLQAPEVRGQAGSVVRDELTRYGNASFEALNVHRDGGRIPVEVNVSRVTGLGGDLYISIVRDITERVRAEKVLRRRAAQLEALREVGMELAAHLDQDTLLRSIASRAVELLGGTAGGLYLYRPGQDVLEWVVDTGPSQIPLGSILHRGEGLAGKVWETGEPMTVDDYNRWQGRAAIYDGLLPAVAVVGTPVGWGDEFLGVLSVAVEADTMRGFSTADADLLSLFATQTAIAIRNVRLYEAERKWAARLAVVNRVARKAVSILDPNQLLQEIVTDIQGSFGYHNVALLLLNETTGELGEQVMAGGFANVAAPDYRQTVGEGIIGWTAKTGQSLLANDVSQEPRYITGFLEEVPTKSELCVPLKLGGRVIGVLDVQDSKLNAFDETDLVAMETLADQIAVAIENARLYEEIQQELAERMRAESQRDASLEALQRRNRELALLNRAAQAFSSSLDLGQVLDTVLDEVRHLLGVMACSAWLTDPQTEELVCRQVTSPQSETVRGWRLAVGQGVAGWVAQHGESLIVPDTRADERHFKGVDQQTGLEIRSILSIPLRVKEGIIGVIQVVDEETNRFDTTDMRLVEALASAAAIAIENARLYADLRASKEYARNIIDSSLDTIIAVDVNRRIVEFNAAAQATFGYRPEEILGQHVDVLYLDTHEGLDIHRTTVEQGKCIQEVLNKRKNGEVFPIFLSASVLRDERGELVGVMGVSRDISERVQAEEALKASLREKEVLLKEIHHRVKNNLQLISSLLDLQSDYIQDPPALAMFKESQNRIKSMSLIHEQLYQSPNLAQIDYAEHIRELAARLFHTHGIAPDAIDLEVHVEDVFLEIDTAIPCGLIVNELLSNALKYAFPPGAEQPSTPGRAAEEDKLSVEMYQDDHQMTLIVSDSGVGLPPDLDFRGTETLGLQLVEMLVQQLEGTIELDRSGGTKFKIRFPS